ncbi:GNAT family acetyltransferase [Rufibacter radiotolerans]|uniref:GNAT family acetyltransferase n=1 Tax=Rufibacter radiotolerans TaxID=1379910 RepID=A0A0H4VHE1_9BACT|nr:GNAT family N-acetyltransferase [Rufibacter radiotolerans]AKQ45095.1 GNAT family acetyltransferase [Rufibacter radiotolerans]
MLELVRTDSTNQAFVALVQLLDADLKRRDGEDHAFYAQFNKIDLLNQVVVAFLNGEPVGCGAIKQYKVHTAEVKRMFVKPEHRGKNIGTSILQELERWASELGYNALILETGKAQPEAIGLYTKKGFNQIPNYGQYEQIENSVCMQKTVTPE